MRRALFYAWQLAPGCLSRTRVTHDAKVWDMNEFTPPFVRAGCVPLVGRGPQ